MHLCFLADGGIRGMGNLHHFTDILAVTFTESRADIHGMSMVTDLFSLPGRGTRRAVRAAFGCSVRTAQGFTEDASAGPYPGVGRDSVVSLTR